MGSSRHRKLLSLLPFALWVLCFRQPFVSAGNQEVHPDLAPQVSNNQQNAMLEPLNQPQRQSPALAGQTAADATPQELSQVLLVATVDGQLHGLKRSSGQWLWSLHAENDSFVPTPLVKSGVSNASAPSAEEETYILEPVAGGNIYVHRKDQASTTKLPLTLAELVEMSPFVFPSAPAADSSGQPLDDRMYVGSRTTSLLGLDLATGRLVGEFGQSNGWCEWREPGLGGGESYEEEIRRRPRDLLYIGRTEYSLSILSRSTGALIQSVAFTSYHPSSTQAQVPLNPAAPHAPSDHRYFQATHDGTLICFQSGAGVNWAQQPFGTNNPIISVFDISIDQASNTPVIHPQPSLYDAPNVPRSLSVLQNLPDAAYVGLLADNSTPFAMSRSHFPLINPDAPQHQQHEPDCEGAHCLVGLQKIHAPTWHSPIVPAPTRLSIGDVAPHKDVDVDEDTRSNRLRKATSPPHPSFLPANDSILTLPPAPIHSHLSAKLTSSLVVIATLVFLLLRHRLFSKRPASSHRVRIQEPTPLERAEKELPPIPTSEEAEPQEDANEGPRRGKRRGKRGKRPMQQAAAAAAAAATENGPANGLTLGTASQGGDLLEGRVGSLVVSNEILGYGSHGTVVLQGTFQGRAVAVKRLLSHLNTLATHEVNLLQESDEHPNVIRYFAKEEHQNFLYIALERCPANLYDLIELPDKHADLVNVFEPKAAMNQIASGLSHLHRLKIIHRDMKPQNILIAPKQTPKGLKLRMLISDFGLCKKLEVDESSFFQTANNATGSYGYRAPEVLKGQVNPNDPSMSPSVSTSASDGNKTVSNDLEVNGLRKRLGRSLDLFSLGCIFYYILTRGEHPFGNRLERELNIVKDRVSLERLDGLGEETHEAQSLIRTMISAEPMDRPTAEQVLLHPFFWTSHKRLNFLCEASDRFEIMERDPPDPILVDLESDASSIVGDDWFKPLDPRLVENLGKYRKYTADSVRDLLRVIRNKKHHYLDLPEPVRKSLGSPPEDFLNYFTHRFPSLFLHVWSVIARNVAHEPQFESNYFKAAD